MHLKRLELFGFKSFADRTVLDFDGNRLTGIVGPNGCGKSNVVDAVRWVLGETRPTSMRGSGMTDVIFKGSVSRPGLSVAEVTLVLDNTDEELAGRGAEVAITRRLYKGGEGEYLIDGGKVRLKDVKDMLFDTGLGSRGYSVLEQGRIDAVLSANPQQRRAIFEEAAGTSRYRQRKHEAELRLKRVAQDMERLEDVMGELRTRVRSLKIQAGKAERYVVAKQEWTTERTLHLKHKLFQLNAELGELRPELTELESLCTELREQRAAHDSEIHETEEARTRVVGDLDRASSDAGRLEGEVRALEERHEQLALRITSWMTSSREEEERAEGLREQLANHRSELGGMVESTAGLEGQVQVAEANAKRLGQEHSQLATQYKEARTAVETQNSKVLEALNRRSTSVNRVQHLDESQEPAQARLDLVAERLSQSVEESQLVQTRVADLQVDVESHTGKKRAVEGECSALSERVSGEKEQCEGLQAQGRELDVEIAGLVARRDSLLDLERQREELSGGTRRLLDVIDEGQGPIDADGLMGVVADHLGIDTRLARALDVVLGERAATLVARDAHVARAIVDWAARDEVGQIPVVVPPGLGAPVCPSPSDYALFARYGNGVEGRLSDLVRCDAEMKALARALCCDVVVVSSLDLALKLVSENPAWRFVTPRGELVDAAGLVGGYREVTQGAVGRRSQADEWTRRIDSLQGKLEAISEEYQRRSEQLSELQAQLQDRQDEFDGLRVALNAAESECASEGSRLHGLNKQVQRATEDQGRLRQELEALKAELLGARSLAESSEVEFENENQTQSRLDQQRLQLEHSRETLGRELGQVQVEKTRAISELTSLKERISSEQKRIEIDSAEIERAEGRACNFVANAEAGESQGVGLMAEVEELRQKRSDMEGNLEGLREQERHFASRGSEVRQLADEVQRGLDASGESLSKGRLREQRLDLSRVDVLERAMDELSLDDWALRQDFEPLEELLETPEPMEALEKRVHELKRVLDKIGPVNVDAVEELEEVAERLDFLETESGDLRDAKRSLLETLNTIDEESRRLFLETFEEVRVGFQRIFRQLFGGGKADILLEPDKDVLEAGIDIIARPPGREMLAIGLLSGGQRTMTALALLFAVFEARPSPFCVLDEVDAALDDANIGRFLSMLLQFVDTTQFIVVTHNKGTMSHCDALFGVTMQVKGVSNFVAVELEQVDEFTPDATGRTIDAQDAQEVASVAETAVDDDRKRDPESGEPVVELVPRSASQEEVETQDDAAQEVPLAHE
ncbi:MAG: chromosome segregation protein [Planctomycetota bacterium]|jgi:chromosome segregation protein